METKTRKCHHCHRHSWSVAMGDYCPWCARKTGKHHNWINLITVLVAIGALVSTAYVASQL